MPSPQKVEDFVLSGPDELCPIPNESLGRYIVNRLKSHGEEVAQVHAVTLESATYGDIVRRSLSLAEGLRLRGVKVGDCIAVCGENSLDFCLPVLATLYLGATVATLSPSYTPRELVHAIGISRPRMVFCSPSTSARITDVARAIPHIRDVISFDQPAFSDLLGNRHLANESFPSAQDRVAAIMCSSGTTGLPKGVMLTENNFLTCIGHLEDRRFGSINKEDVTLALLPFFHAYAFVMQLATLCFGLKVVVMPKFEEEVFLRSIQEHKITLMFLVPPVLVFLGKHPLVLKYDLTSVTQIWSGAAPLSEEVQTHVTRRINVKHIRQGYGLTETTLGVLLTPPDWNKYGASGILAPGTQCKVLDLVTGDPVGPNISGELCFRGPLIMRGYLGDRQATSGCLDKDGFLRTGDIGYYDRDGFFYIVDRLKELIKYKGFQVPPAELEAILLTHPGIKDAAVIGIPDQRAGELPLAFVVLQPGGKTLNERDVADFVAGQVSPQKRLRGGVRFVSEIPKNPSGKILRRELRELYKKSKL